MAITRPTVRLNARSESGAPAPVWGLLPFGHSETPLPAPPAPEKHA